MNFRWSSSLSPSSSDGVGGDHFRDFDYLLRTKPTFKPRFAITSVVGLLAQIFRAALSIIIFTHIIQAVVWFRRLGSFNNFRSFCSRNFPLALVAAYCVDADLSGVAVVGIIQALVDL